ncbi:MAG: hypothetical protein HC851_04570 [Acaryochloris sp. RU_4_1]|nr:hypothetical protein [Acaryochloridaceae cyanobacterium SU_2_1]NJM64979.1 hypothetical protein [Acaryochloris sp. RU_4_1]
MDIVSKREINATLKKNHRLQVFESLCTLAVLLGAVATLVTQNMVLAALPLTLFLWINLQHRQQLDRLSQQFATLKLDNLERSLAVDLQAIQEHLQDRDHKSGRVEEVECQQRITTLTARITPLEAKGRALTQGEDPALQALDVTLQELKAQALGCAQALATLDPFVQTHIALRSLLIHKLADCKATLNSSPLPTPADFPLYPSAYAQLCSSVLVDVSNLRDRLQPLMVQVEQWQQRQQTQPILEQISQIQDHISQLNQQLQKKHKAWSLQFLPYQQSVQALQTSLHGLQTQLADCCDLASREQKTILSIGLVPESTVLQDLEVEDQIQLTLAPVQVQLVTLENQLDQLCWEIQIAQNHAEEVEALQRQILTINTIISLITQSG